MKNLPATFKIYICVWKVKAKNNKLLHSLTFFMFSFSYAVFRSETAEKWFWKSCWRGNLSFWYRFRVCLSFVSFFCFEKEGSLFINSWERGFGNRVKFFRLLFQFNVESFLFERNNIKAWGSESFLRFTRHTKIQLAIIKFLKSSSMVTANRNNLG